jgi:hypothetical protein
MHAPCALGTRPALSPHCQDTDCRLIDTHLFQHLLAECLGLRAGRNNAWRLGRGATK